MKSNIGTMDKVIRVMTVVVITVLYSLGLVSGMLAIILVALAGYFAATSLMGICPLYTLFGFSTRERRRV